MSIWRSLTRLPPSGSPTTPRQCRLAVRIADPAESLRSGLRSALGASRVTLHASGREALRVALSHAAAASGRDEILVPGYACYSIPAAAVAAGLRVRLVDVGLDGRIDPDALARTPLAGVAALVIGNLFGVPEPVDSIRSSVRAQAVAVVDDAAQSLGARSPEGPAGGRGDIGVLSFGRGKPLSALGGGALAWSASDGPERLPEPEAPRCLAALTRAVGHNLALLPWAFRWLAAIPALEIGETRYDPNFARGPIDGASLCLAAALLPDLEASNRARARRAAALAHRVASETRFAPLLAPADSEGVFPRLALLAPNPDARDDAVRLLAPVGATGMYPGCLASIDALRPHLTGEPQTPGAREFAARLLTLPTEKTLRGRRLAFALRTLRELS